MHLPSMINFLGGSISHHLPPWAAFAFAIVLFTSGLACNIYKVRKGGRGRESS